MLTMKDEENTGDKYCDKAFLNARQKTINVVENVFSQIYVGMSEQAGHHLLDLALESAGAEKLWHPSKFRIGINTTKSFKDKSDDTVRLEEGNCLFIDIGPVFLGHEGDFGKTLCFGTNKENYALANAAKNVFDHCALAFKERAISGSALYKVAEERAQELGFKLNRRMSGHRLGDFPHALHHRGTLADAAFIPTPHLWILEIHLLNLDETQGAFYEDLISSNF